MRRILAAGSAADWSPQYRPPAMPIPRLFPGRIRGEDILVVSASDASQKTRFIGFERRCFGWEYSWREGEDCYSLVPMTCYPRRNLGQHLLSSTGGRNDGGWSG